MIEEDTKEKEIIREMIEKVQREKEMIEKEIIER